MKGSLLTARATKEELERLQMQKIIVPLDVDETSEWCNCFVLVPKANEKVRLYMDLGSLNKVLMRPIHRVQPSTKFYPD